MIKKRFLTLVIMLCAFIAIAGAGYSSWYFSNQRRADVNSNVYVTHANTFGKFSDVSNGAYVLMLDQPTSTNENITLCTGTGVNSTAVTSLNATWNVSLTSYKDTLNGTTTPSIEASKIEYSILVYIKTDTLGKYVEVTTSTDGFSTSGFREVAGEHNHRNEGYTAYKLTLTNFSSPESDRVFTEVSENTNATKTGAYVTIPANENDNVTVKFQLDLVDVPFKWKEGKAPTTFQQYQDMIMSLACKDVTSASDVVGGKSYETEGQEVIFEFCVYNTSEGVPTIDVTNSNNN